MGPETRTAKTAFIFYLVYAALIGAVALWLPKTGLFPQKDAGHKQPLGNGYVEQLQLKQQEYEKAWQKILAHEGFIPKAVYKIQKSRQLSRKIGNRRIEWTFSENTIVLPKAAGKNSLIALTFKWKELVRQSGFNIHGGKWGYSNGLLWVKLDRSFPVGVGKKYSPSLPMEYLTMVLPVTGFQGRLPGLIPELPPIIPDLGPPPTEAIPTPTPAKKVEAEEQTAPLPAGKKARIAIIIDDVGYVVEAAEAMLKVPAPLTFSVLPFGPYSLKYAEAAKERGFGVMLHLPLEPMNPSVNPGPGVIKRSFSEAEVAAELEKDLEQVPEATGINNHEGSAGTSDPRLMEILMKEIKKRGLFFVDSMTASTSVAAQYARNNQIPCTKRKVFIDNQTDLMSKKAALRVLMKIALRDGEAVGIGHVRENTAQAIIEMLPEFSKAGIEVVPVAELVR